MKEQLKSWVFYQDGEYLWCYDEIISALSRVDMNSLQVECIVSPMQLLVNGQYQVGNLLGWKDHIIIIPVEISRKWALYNKQDGEIEYDFFCSENYRVAEVILSGNMLVLFPISVKGSILVVDLLKRTVVRRFNLPDLNFSSEKDMEIWSVKVEQDSIYFLIQNSFFYGRLDAQGIQVIEINVNEPLACADFNRDTGWAISSSGKHLYHFDYEGKQLEKYLVGSKTEYTKMVIENNRIFLLPVDKSEIIVFEIDSKHFKKIGGQQESIACGFLELLNMPSYWGYIKKHNNIWFLPLKYSLEIVDLETLVCNQRKIEYSEDFSKKLYWDYCKFARMYKEFVYRENLSNSGLENYLDFIKKSNLSSGKDGELTDGKNIWEKFR